MEPQPEPGYGRYTAEQSGGEVIIQATGETPTPGYTVRLEQSMLDVFPPEFVLVWTPPGGLVADVLTPFSVSASFSADDAIEAVTVRDADGDHRVPVEQA